MRKKIMMLVVFLMFILAGNISASSNLYEDDSYKLAAFKGWDVLEQETNYVFQGVYFPKRSRVFDFILEQDELAKSDVWKAYSYIELEAMLKEKYTPIILEILVKEEIPNLNIAIEAIATPFHSFEAEIMYGWEKQYSQVKVTGGSYYYLSVPKGHNYTLVFFLPKSLMQSEVRVVFQSPRVVLEIPSDNQESIYRRIDSLITEIERLQELVGQRKDE